MTDKTICRNDGRCEYAIQAGIEGLAQCQAGKCSMPKPANLTIPGALEWDGDNGTHGVVGTHSADGESRADGESSELERLKEKLEAIRARPNSIDHSAGAKIPNALDAWGRPVPQYLPYDFSGNPGASATQYCNGWNDSGSYWKNHVIDIEAQLANTEQSRRSFFDLSQDLEKRLAERDALIAKVRAKLGEDWLDRYAGLDETREEIDIFLSDVAATTTCESCGDWGHIETEDSAHDCPECGPSVIERAVEDGVMNAPSKPKTCIECDQPYCHGVCVERGDQDYDRDQAAKGGDDE